MNDTLPLDPNWDDQKLLAQVVGYYHNTLKTNADALKHLTDRGITSTQTIDRFRLGYSDRSLGLKLPLKAIQSGEAIRTRLRHLGLYRESGHEHFRGSITVPILAADGSGQIVDIYGRKTHTDLRKGTPLDTHLNDHAKACSTSRRSAQRRRLFSARRCSTP